MGKVDFNKIPVIHLFHPERIMQMVPRYEWDNYIQFMREEFLTADMMLSSPLHQDYAYNRVSK